MQIDREQGCFLAEIQHLDVVIGLWSSDQNEPMNLWIKTSNSSEGEFFHLTTQLVRELSLSLQAADEWLRSGILDSEVESSASTSG